MLELLERPGLRTLALGGGAVTSERVRAALRGHEVVWLDVDSDVAWERASGPDRPLAADRSAFAQLHAARDPLYASVATATVLPGADPVAGVAALAEPPGGDRRALGPRRRGRVPGRRGGGRGARLVVARHAPPLHGHRRARARRARPGRARPSSCRPGEGAKTLATAERVWRWLAGRGRHPRRPRRRGRRRRRRRPRRLLRQRLPARHGGRAGADHARRPGRLGLRRQDRRRPARGQELRRRLPPAPGRARRSGAARHRCPRPSSRPGTPRSSRPR